MSQPKRYDDQGVWKCLYYEGSTNGWVKWDDYATLAAENERLRKDKENADGYIRSLEKQLAAKEGRDAK